MSSPETVLKNYISDGSDRKVQECISKLKFISRIKEGEILDTKSLTLQDRDWTVSVYRTVIDRKQGRDTSLEFYQTVINEAFSLCISYLEHPVGHFLNGVGIKILDSLDSVIPGLQSHIKTYTDDVNHVSKVETLVETTENKISNIRSSINKQTKENSSNQNRKK